MAVTSNTYTVGGSGQAGPYSYSFPIIASTDIRVTVNGALKTVTTHYTIDTGNTRITFVSGQEPSTGDKVIVYRDTDEDPINATFVSGSTIRSNELNDNFKQLLYISQESDNQSMSTLGGTMQADFGLGKDADIVFEGSTDNAHETTLTVADPTADRTITLPNTTGTVVTTGDTGTVTSTMIADLTIATADIANSAVTIDKIGPDAVDGTKIGNRSINSEHIAITAVDTEHIADLQVTRPKIANDAIDGTKLADDSVDSEHIVADSIDTEHYAANSVDATAIANGAVGETQLANGGVANSKLAANAVGSSNIIDGHIIHTKLGADAVDGDNIADDSINSEHIVDGSIDLAHLSANSVDSSKIVDGSIVNDDINASAAISQSKVALDAELVTLAGMPSDTASILASATALTSTTAELNLLDGKSIVTSVSGSSTDVQLPTAKAVNDQIVATIQDVGGFYPIDDELKFPNTNPDPNDDAGTIVSIADAGGIVVNGSGVSTTGRTLGGATVTINGIDSTLNNTTIAAGKGMLVQTTSTLNTYTYHRLVVDEAGVASAQTLVTDFNQRYQVASSAPSNQPDGTALAEGDLFFNTGTNKMMVYDGSNYAEVTSVGDYKLLTVVPAGATSGTPDYTNTEFDLRDGSSAASVTSVGQLLISVNGVLQKPNAGTSIAGSAEGFCLADSNTIKFATAPGSGASVFVTLIGSATTVQVPADNSVSTVKIQNLAVNADKLAADAVTGAKIADDTITEAKLDIHAAPSGTDKFLKYTSNGMEWAVPSYTTNTDTNVLAGGTITGDVIFDNATNADKDLTWDMSDNALEFKDNVLAAFGDAKDLQIFHDGTNTKIHNATGTLGFRADNLHINNAADNENLATFTANGAVNLYYDNVKEFETKSGGVKLNGHSEQIVTALTSASTVTIDFSLSNHFSCTMGHNITFANPSTESIGQSGTITLTQDGTGSRTAAWGTQFLWAGGTAPTLTTTANAIDRIDYVVVAADKIHCVATLALD